MRECPAKGGSGRNALLCAIRASMKISPDNLREGEAPETEPPDEASLMSPRERWRSIKDSMNLIGVSEVGLFVIALGFTLHKMKPVLLPLVLAIMVSLMLQPVYRFLRRLRLLRILASAATVGGLVALMVVGGMQLVGPTIEWKRTVNYQTMSTRVQEVFRPMKQVRANLQEVAEKVQEATKSER